MSRAAKKEPGPYGMGSVFEGLWEYVRHPFAIECPANENCYGPDFEWFREWVRAEEQKALGRC